jgi:hypothetical protein
MWIKVLMWYCILRPHGIVKSTIGVFTLIQRVNILKYAQHAGTTIMG